MGVIGVIPRTSFRAAAARPLFLGLLLAFASRSTFAAAPETSSNAPAAPETAPLSIRRFHEIASEWGETRVLRVAGTVTASLSDKTYFLQDGDSGVYVFHHPPQALPVGTWLEVSGRASLGGFLPSLQDATILGRRPGDSLSPTPANVEEILSGQLDMRLVRLRGRLGRERPSGSSLWILLDDRNHGVLLNWDAIEHRDLLDSIAPDSLIEIIGVCSVRGGKGTKPGRVQIFPRSVDDVRLLAPPPWWNRDRVAAALLAALGAGLLSAAWAWLLRRQIRRRTLELQEQLARTAALEIRYRQLFDTHPLPMWVYDRDTLRFLAVNDAAVFHYGFTREEFARLTLRDIRPPDDIPALERNIAAIAHGLDPAGVWRHRKKNGAIIHVEVTSHTLDFDGHRAELVVAVDVTDRQAAQAALLESEQYRRAIIEAEPECVKVLGAEGNLLDINAAGLAMLELDSVEEARARFSLPSFILPEYQENFLRNHHQALEGHQATLEFEIIGARGTHRWMESRLAPLPDRAGNLTRVLGITRDITARKQAETELLQSQERFATIFRACPDAILIVRSSDERTLDANPAFEHLFGVTRSELLGHTTIELGLWSNPVQRADLVQILKQKGSLANIETRLRSRHRGEVTVLASAEMIEVGGEPCMLSLLRDVTELRASEQKRHALELKLQHTQKLESLGVLAGGIAHDFNNLLTVVMGNLSLASMDLPAASPVRVFVREAENGTQRAADLARQMLAYSGKGRFMVQKVPLADAVEEMKSLLRVSVAKKVDLSYHLAPETPVIEVDTTQLRQIVLNLVINASEAIGERSGVISIATGIVACDPTRCTHSWTERPETETSFSFLEVSDTGCGISPDNLARIFDPFFTTKFTGRGLGLASVLGIIRGHRAALNVSSSPGQGTTFKVLFPIAAAPSQPLPGPSSETKEWLGHGWVLLADDEEDNRSIASLMLRRLGFDVLTASDGRQALETVRSRAEGEALRCVILDLTMPTMDGCEALHEIRLLQPRLPVVLSSGYSEHDITKRFGDHPPSAFIPKPYSLDGLRDVLSRILEPASPPSDAPSLTDDDQPA